MRSCTARTKRVKRAILAELLLRLARQLREDEES
jgi:hypothetical protein